MRALSRPAVPVAVLSVLVLLTLWAIAGVTPANAAESAPDAPQSGTEWTTDLDGMNGTGLADIAIFVCGYLNVVTCDSNCWCAYVGTELDFSCDGTEAGLPDLAIMGEAYLGGITRTGKCD